MEVHSGEKEIKFDSDQPFLNILKETPFYEPLQSVLHWRDPIRSGLLFAIGNLLFFLITFAEYSLLSILSLIGLVLLFSSFIYVKFFQLRGAPNPLEAKFKETDLAISPEAMEKFVVFLLRMSYYFQNTLRNYFYFIHFGNSVKAFIASIILYFVGQIFSGAFILYLAFLAAFCWPNTYGKYKNEIDAQYKKIYDATTAKFAPVVQRIEKYFPSSPASTVKEKQQ